MKFSILNLLVSAGVPLLLLAAVVTTSPASYLYCVSQEESWMASETRRELEGKFVMYSSEEGTPDEEGRREVRYLILYKSPLVVTYAPDERIENIFLEYE
ncbi:hypothetical protein [Haloferula sp.]|uniref:hypothetical protein n=1 Tax=Haloferula sp. TaxID=2497595 RepID=UPI00329C6B84